MLINRYDIKKHHRWRTSGDMVNFMSRLTRFYPPTQIMLEKKDSKYYSSVLRGINHYDTEKLKKSITSRINEPSAAREIHRRAWRVTLQRVIDIEKSIKENGR